MARIYGGEGSIDGKIPGGRASMTQMSSNQVGEEKETVNSVGAYRSGESERWMPGHIYPRSKSKVDDATPL